MEPARESDLCLALDPAVCIAVMEDLGLSKTVIARYFGASDAEIAALRASRSLGDLDDVVTAAPRLGRAIGRSARGRFPPDWS
jgi:hypothetical protein